VEHLTALQHLFVEDNLLRTLPVGLAKLPNLVRAYSDGNPVQDIDSCLLPLLTTSSMGMDSVTTRA
jgi:Leucine-rich repeat (LRR) protein